MVDIAKARPNYEIEAIARLTVLLQSIPGWARNYTATKDAAEWVVDAATRVGWVASVNNHKL